MKLKRIGPKMEHMEEVEGMAVIAIEATTEEAARIGHLLFKPIEVVPAVDFIEESDLFGDFLDQFFTVRTVGQVSSRDLYDVFACWCSTRLGASKYTPSMRKVGEFMRDRGFVRIKTDRVYWGGLSWNDPRNDCAGSIPEAD